MSLRTRLASAPRFAKQFLFDAAKGALMAVAALNLVIPSSLTEAKGFALILGVSVIRAIFGAAGAAIPAFLAYLAGVLEIEDDTVDAIYDIDDDELEPEGALPPKADELDLMADRKDLTDLTHF